MPNNQSLGSQDANQPGARGLGGGRNVGASLTFAERWGRILRVRFVYRSLSPEVSKRYIWQRYTLLNCFH